MERFTSQVDQQSRTRLRRAVAEVNRRSGKSIPHAALPALAGELASLPRRPAALTLDFGSGDDDPLPLIIVRTAPAESHAPSPNLAGLSAREREVASLVARGLSNKEIAVRLGIRLSTVKDHVHHILDRTGLPGRAAIVLAWHTDERS